jgi:UDP-N-acetylglucosamine enolpyruvyl transferase
MIAAALAEGTTTLKGVQKIERGYGHLQERLKNISLDFSAA